MTPGNSRTSAIHRPSSSFSISTLNCMLPRSTRFYSPARLFTRSVEHPDQRRGSIACAGLVRCIWLLCSIDQFPPRLGVVSNGSRLLSIRADDDWLLVTVARWHLETVWRDLGFSEVTQYERGRLGHRFAALNLPRSNQGALDRDSLERSQTLGKEAELEWKVFWGRAQYFGIVVTPLPRWDVGVSVIARSSHPFRGDEANLIDSVDGYVTLAAQVSYQLLDPLQLFVKAQNLLDTEYETFGLLAEPDEVLEGASDPRFLGPGAPFGIWAGVVVSNL